MLELRRLGSLLERLPVAVDNEGLIDPISPDTLQEQIRDVPIKSVFAHASRTDRTWRRFCVTDVNRDDARGVPGSHLQSDEKD